MRITAVATVIACAMAGAFTTTMALPAIAAADPAICHNGILSDDAGQGCADAGQYAQSSSTGDGAICHNGILSDDAGQGCADGLYEQVYGSGGSAPVSSSSAPSSSGSGYGGSSNSMVNPQCESGGNAQVRDPSGTYWGKYQFDYQTWVAFGGSPGSYGNAGVAEQDSVASRVTYDAWPNC